MASKDDGLRGVALEMVEAGLFPDSNTGHAAAQAAAQLKYGWFYADHATYHAPDVDEVIVHLQAWKAAGFPGPTTKGGAR